MDHTVRDSSADNKVGPEKRDLLQVFRYEWVLAFVSERGQPFTESAPSRNPAMISSPNVTPQSMVATPTEIIGAEDRTMTVSELIDRLQACDLNSEILLQVDRRMFVSPTWVGIMDTADLLAEEKEYRLVISPWEPDEDLKASADQRQERKNS